MGLRAPTVIEILTRRVFLARRCPARFYLELVREWMDQLNLLEEAEWEEDNKEL